MSQSDTPLRTTPQPSSPSHNHLPYGRDDRERTPTQQQSAALVQVATPAQSGSPNGDWSQTLQNLINSPEQLQRLMHALASQQNQPVPSMVPSDIDHQTLDPRAAAYQMTPYDPNTYDFSRFRTELPPSAANNHAQSAALAPSLLGSLSQKEDDIDVPSLEPLVENANRLQKNYRDASEIDADVDALQLSLNSLINGLGLDPGSLASASRTPDPGPGPLDHSADGIAPHTDGLPHDPTADFDFDAFLNELSTRNGADSGFSDVTTQFDPTTPLDGTTVGDASTDQLTAFLDDVDPGPIVEPLSKATAGVKRKSDVAELPPPILSQDTLPTSTAPKVKRKR